MVTHPPYHRNRGFLMTDLMVAMAILGLVLVPLTLSLLPQQRLATKLYQDAVLLELMDGELEVLQAGAWREETPGRRVYRVRGEARRSLPEGEFYLVLGDDRIRLEWHPADMGVGGRSVVAREVMRR